MPGVRGVFTARSLQPGKQHAASVGQVQHQQQMFSNASGHVCQDEETFASSEVHACGQLIALVVADTERQASAVPLLARALALAGPFA